MKTLILGAGRHVERKPGHTYLDVMPFQNIDIVHNLNKTPWPIPDNSYELICAIHLVEHLDSLVNFMNECHRILVKGGELYLETPTAGIDIDLTHADPTHVRCYRPHSFLNYFTIQGINAWGYTDRAWSIRFITQGHEPILRLSAEPLK